MITHLPRGSRTTSARAAILAVGLTGLLLAAPTQAGVVLIANDEKVTWDEVGKLVLSAPGRDTVSVVDIGSPSRSWTSGAAAAC